MTHIYSHKVGPEVVDDGAEREAVPPRCGHVGDLDPFVTLRDLLAPGQQVHGWGAPPVRHPRRGRGAGRRALRVQAKQSVKAEVTQTTVANHGY